MAILKLRRGTSIPSLAESELFYHTSLDTLVVGDGSNGHILLKSGSNTVNLVDISGTISASYIHVTNDLTIKGNLTLGDQDTDNIVISAELSSSLIPDVNNTFDIGSSLKKWRHIYATSASIDDITLNSSGIVSSSQQISDYNTFLEIDGMGVFSGSSQVNANTITNFDSNVKDKMNDDSVISGSSQLTTEFDTRYLNTNGDSVISSSAQLTTEFDTRYLNTEGDSVISSSAQLTTEFDTRYLNTNGDGVISSSAQLDGVFLEINGDGVFSGSSQVVLNDADKTGFNTADVSEDSSNLYYTDTRVKTKLNTEGVISGSSQVNANDITNFDSNVKDKMNSDGVVSGSTQLEGEFLQINGDGVISSSAQLDGVFLEINGDGVISGSDQINSLFVGTAVSTSLDSRLDSLETDSHTHANKANLDTINQDLATTDNVTFDTGSFTGNVTVTGNLTVLGSATEIQTSELRIEDKLITVASGSVDSTAADGAGLEIDGANKSLTWDHNSTSFVFDAKVSSSVGFKGEGGELTGIDTDQVTEAGNLYYTNTRVLDYINDQGVISGSSQVDYDNIQNQPTTISSAQATKLSNITITQAVDLDTLETNVSTNNSKVGYTDSLVKTKLDAEGVISGSSQITITESQISDLDHYTDIDVKAKLNIEGVLSGSGQLITEFDSRYLNTDRDSVVSGSSQIDVTQTTNYGSINQYSDTKVKTKLTAENVLSSSQQVIDSLPNGLVSGSEQITDGSGIISSSTFQSNQQGSFTSSINGTNTNVDLGLEESDSPTFAGLTLTGTSAALSTEYTALFLTGSDNSITRRELATAAFYNVSSSIDDGNPNVLGSAGAVKTYVDGKIIEAGSGDITQVTPTPGGGLSGGGFVGAVSLSLDTGSTHFTDGVVENLPSGLVSQSSQLYTDLDSRYIQDLGEGAFSSSAQVDHDATTNFVANEHIDHSTITIGSGKGLTGGGTITTSRSLTLATGSDHFLDGVKDKINLEGVFSSSAQITITESQISDLSHYTDSDVLAYINDLGVQSGSDTVDYTDADTLAYINDLGVISGSSQVDATSVTNFDSNVLTYINDLGVHSGSFLGTATTSNLSEGSNLYYTNTRVLQYINDLGVQSGSDTPHYTDSDTLAYINDLGVISGSSQVNANSITNFDSNVKDKLNDDGVISGSSQIDVTSTTNYSSINQYSNTKVLNYINDLGVQSGSDTPHYTDSDNLTYLNDLGVFSGSSQVVLNDADKTGFDTADVTEGTNLYYTDARVKTKLNTEDVVSGSSQITLGGDVTGTADSNTVEKVQGVSLTSGEATQISNIDSVTISNTQWGYLGDSNQGIATTNNVQFNNLVLSGDLTVQGTTTTLNTEELTIEDKLLSVASGSTTYAQADGAGFHISGSDVSITWDNANNRLAFSTGSFFTGSVQASGDIIAYASSDERLKDEIIPISNPIEKINSIGGYSFVWNEEKQNIYKGKDYGVIAQEIEEILPELVDTRENGYKAVKYDKLVSLLIEGIKELSKEVTELKNKIRE